jgi:hypothetical protein
MRTDSSVPRQCSGQARLLRRSASSTGRPTIVCQFNVAAGPPEIVNRAGKAIADYYAFTGRSGWGAPISDMHEIAGTIDGYRRLGADEVVLYCYADDPDQVDILAGLVKE